MKILKMLCKARWIRFLGTGVAAVTVIYLFSDSVFGIVAGAVFGIVCLIVTDARCEMLDEDEREEQSKENR